VLRVFTSDHHDGVSSKLAKRQLAPFLGDGLNLGRSYGPTPTAPSTRLWGGEQLFSPQSTGLLHCYHGVAPVPYHTI